MALVLDWQKKLGYSKDPFDALMLPAGKFLVGMHELQERLNLFLIKEERFGTISGEAGTGKTLLLQWMNEELAPQKSHLQQLLDGKMRRDEIINTLLEARLSFFERSFGGKLKLPEPEREKELLQRLSRESKNVLLIDNAGSLAKHELELLADISTKTPTYIIIADTEERLKRLDLPSQLSDKLKLKTPSYTHEQLAELLRRRIESVGVSGTHPFDDAELAALIKKADRNPAKLLTASRERAIELSLKVSGASAPKAQAAPQVKSTGFFSIKVEKVDKTKHAAAPSAHETHASATPHNARDRARAGIRESEIVLPADASEDGDLLAKVVENSEHPQTEAVIVEGAGAPAAQQKTTHDKVVEKLAQELGGRNEGLAKAAGAAKKATAKSHTNAAPAKKKAKL